MVWVSGQSELKGGREGDGGPMRRTRLRLRVCDLYKTLEASLGRSDVLSPT